MDALSEPAGQRGDREEGHATAREGLGPQMVDLAAARDQVAS